MPPRGQQQTDQDKPETRRVHVLTHVYNYRVPSGVPSAPWDTVTVRRGDEVDLPVAELERAARLDREFPLPHGPRFGTADDLFRVESSESSTGPLEPERLRSMSFEDVGAYLSQHPEHAEHVANLEQAGDQPRQDIVEMAEQHAAARDQAVAARAEQEARAAEAGG